jgi:FAD/FMN-containing dehydrogenase
MNRRTLLRAGVGLTAALASRENKATTSATDCSCDVPLGESGLYCEKDACIAAAYDFGNIISAMPRAVLTPASSADIAAIVRSAPARKLQVAARGQGHSTYGRCMVADGVIIDMRRLNTIDEIHAGRVVVGAGAMWKSVLEATLVQGLTPPVLTNYLNLSVGGTLAVGGIGGTSSRFGMQTDQVLELDVVTGDGRELKCSRDSHPDLFDAVRGGLGQCGIVTRATLGLTRAPDRVRRYQLLYTDLASLVADQRRVMAEDRFDQLQGAIIPDGKGAWHYQLEGAVHYHSNSVPDDRVVLADLSDKRGAAVVIDLTYRDDAVAFEKLEAMLRSKGLWSGPQPWLFTFLAGSDAESEAAELMRGLTVDDLGTFGRITFYPLRTDAFHTPLVRLPQDSVAFSFNVVRVGTGKEKVEQSVSQNRALYEQIRRAGGVLYPVSAFPMSSEDWKLHFATRWPAFAEARRRYDPHNVLTPGYEVF